MNLGATSKILRGALEPELTPDSVRARSDDEKSDVIETYLHHLDTIHMSALERMSERLGSIRELRPTTLAKLERNIQAHLSTQGLSPSYSRHVLPRLSEATVSSEMQHALDEPDAYRKYVQLSRLAFVGEHLPKEALPELLQTVNEVSPGWKKFVFSSLAQLHRGMSGESAEETALRESLIDGVFSLGAHPQKLPAMKVALAGFWPHLNELQRVVVADAATHILTCPTPEDEFDGLSQVHSRSHGIDTHGSAQAFGGVVHTLPIPTRTAFLRALRNLSDTHFARTVDVLGADFHEHFPEIFAEARTRVATGWEANAIDLNDIPLRMRPHEVLGVPKSLRTTAAFTLTEAPSSSFDDVFGGPHAPREHAEFVYEVASADDAGEIIDAFENDAASIRHSAWTHIGLFPTRIHGEIVDALIRADFLTKMNTNFFSKISPEATAKVSDYAAKMLAADTNAALPPIDFLHPEHVRGSLSETELDHWKRDSQTRLLRDQQHDIALALDQALPALQHSDPRGLDAWLINSRREWLQSLP